MKPFATGAKPRIKKKTDYKISSFKKMMGSATPVTLAPVTTIYMQNQEPSCGEHSATQVRNIQDGITGSPMMAWKTLRKIDGLDPTDGSTTGGIGIQAKNVGVCDLTLMPDDSTLSNADYASYTGITQAILDNAAPRKVPSYAFDDGPFTIQSIQEAVAQHGAVILRVSCGTGFWVNQTTGQNSWGVDLFPLKLGVYDDDHFICVTDPARSAIPIPNINPNYIYFVNSWSDQWGFNGWGWFDATYLSQIKEMLVFVPPVTPNNPTPSRYQFSNIMYFGQTSADIHALQGILGVPQTGFYWFATAAAVSNYQKVNGLKNGSLGFVVQSDMMSKLNS